MRMILILVGILGAALVGFVLRSRRGTDVWHEVTQR